MLYEASTTCLYVAKAKDSKKMRTKKGCIVIVHDAFYKYFIKRVQYTYVQVCLYAFVFVCSLGTNDDKKCVQQQRLIIKAS